MSKFNIFTIDSRVILSMIVATGVYALLLKFLQKNSPHDVQTKGGGGVKGLLNNVQKNCTFLKGWLPLLSKSNCNILGIRQSQARNKSLRKMKEMHGVLKTLNFPSRAPG